MMGKFYRHQGPRLPEPYVVGYARPPKHCQFQPGQSGNPNGRPKKKPVNLMSAIDKALYEPVKVKKNGKTVSMPAIEAMLELLRNEALGGDMRAMRLMRDFAAMRPAPQDQLEPPIVNKSAIRARLDAILARSKDKELTKEPPGEGG